MTIKDPDGFEYHEYAKFLYGFVKYDPPMLYIEQRLEAIKYSIQYMLKVTPPTTPPILAGGSTPKEFLQSLVKDLHNHVDAIDRLVEEL